MKRPNAGAVRRFFTDESGQMLPLVSLMLIGLLATGGFVVDVGRALYSQHLLQSSCDAAALAGASALPGSTAVSVATQYSGLPGELNASSSLPTVSMVSGYPKVECLTTLTAEGQACVSPGNGKAVAAKEQVTLSLPFLSLIGKSKLTLAASATASMRGASAGPYNVVIIVDATESMNDTDSDSSCNSTRLSCALSGVQILLQDLSPCGSSQTTCGTATSGNVAKPLDEVAMYTFPAVTTATVADDYTCTSTKPTTSAYTEPKTTPPYQVVGFSSDYRTSDTASSLNTASNIVIAAGGKSGCTGLKGVGGYGTYYAGVIYAAQAALVAESKVNPGAQNVMILLSDGDAGTTSKDLPDANETNGSYVSVKQQCHQAITDAAAAAAAGTHVYTVAYGAESSGCSDDTSPTITPCQTMQQIASAPQYFYSDYTASGGTSSCVSSAHPTSGLSEIFTQIAGDLTVGRLIPDNTT
jgi:Flp pilus assembly protein TadG